MQSIDWDNVRHFLAVVRAGSVSLAAQTLRVNQTTVSRRISALEKHLGKTLFERSANSWLITPVGERLIKAAEQMAEEIQTIERFVMAESQEISGKLRLTVGDICTQQLVMPAILAFTQQYPEIDLEIVATNNDLDLSAREADIAVRTTDRPPPNLIGKRVAHFAYAIYGQKKYLALHKAKQGIACITWIGDGHTRPPWIEKNFPTVKHVYRSSDSGFILQMLKQGIGIAQLPCALCDPLADLYRIPVQYVEPSWGLWILSHVDIRTTARVRIFKEFLLTELEKNKDLIEGRMSGTPTER